MKSTLSLQVDTDLLLQLIEQLRRRGGSQDVSEGIGTAIACWLALQADAGAAAIAGPDYPRGYQWKSLFLPEGTVLRSWSYGEHNYAHVDGDRIIHRGRAVTPNQFAQSFAHSTRNAWRDLFVRRPGDKQFKLASLLRRELATPEIPAAQPAPASHHDALGGMLAALLPYIPLETIAQPAVKPVATPAIKPAVESPPVPCRDAAPGPGWTLPERRKFRYRLEDVAFE